MRPASFAEAAQQHCVGRLEKNDLRRNHLADGLQDAGKLAELGAFANVDDQRGAADIARLQRQFGEVRNQFDRKIVDAVVAEIFEGFKTEALPEPLIPVMMTSSGEGWRARVDVLSVFLRIFPARSQRTSAASCTG